MPVALELFANLPSTTVTSGGTGAPAPGTTETWTVASSSKFPAASNSATPPTQFHVADTASSSEIITVTNVSGTTWTVTRGAESTTPVTHVAGFTVYQVVSAGGYSGFAQFPQISGSRPEWYGTIGAGSDDVAINAAITAVNAGNAPGPVVLAQPYVISSTITLKPGVNLEGTGQGNRQVGPPDTFTGGYISPSNTFPTSTPLITIGTASAPTTNPTGAILSGVCLSGYCNSAAAYVSGCVGVLVTDTADVHMRDCFIANMDRGGATGTCVQLSSASSGNSVGFDMTNCVLSASWRGLYGDGAGVTDLRVTGNLFHSNTEGLTLGATAGGGGGQFANNHYTYSGMPSTGWHVSLGAQSGDFMFANEYFDVGGSARVVQLATAKGIFSGNHFLATSTSTAVSLVKLSTSANQEITFCNNDCNGNGSSITALFQTSAHSGAPTGGVYVGNAVYGTAASLVAVLIDSASSAISAANTSSLYVQGNVQFT
jgi:hypothetical protein